MSPVKPKPGREIPEAFPLSSAVVHNRASITGSGPVTVFTDAPLWSYAAAFRLRTKASQLRAGGGPLIIQVETTVESGRIGFLFVADDLQTVLGTTAERLPEDGPSVSEIVIDPAPDSGWLIVRNHSPGGRPSTCRISEIRAFRATSARHGTPAPDPQPLSIFPGLTERMTGTHPVFAHFQGHSGVVEPGFRVDLIGAKTRDEFLSGAAAFVMEVEDYFEWIDVLESVLAAREKYTIVELGAGYGRWTVRAACAVRRGRPQLPFHLIAVEAEPKHFQWLKQHLLDNEIDPGSHTLLQAAVSDQAGEAMFYVGRPEPRENVAAEWYGQAMTKYYDEVDGGEAADYEGFEVVKLKSGWQAIKTKCLLLTEIISDIQRVDLIHMDVQGEEFKVVRSAIDVLDHNTARLHIGTHEREIEDDLRRLLTAHGWRCEADYKCLDTNETPWGPVAFSDGVQSWVNPRLG
jgi:FkbM family methyltransferase